MAVRFHGLVQVTGEHDSGKTTFALGASDKPKDICVVDDDIKTKTIVDELGSQNLGMYIDLVNETKDMKETSYFDHCMNIINKRLPECIKNERKGKKFELLVWDTWARFENTIQPMVLKAPSKYRESYSPKGDIKGAQIWQASFDYEAQILSTLQSVADLVIIVSHLKADSLNGVKTGRLVPDSKRPITQKCFMRIYLRHNPDHAAPIGLVLKRPSKHVITDKGIETINVLPRKMNPITWDRINNFWEHPVGDISFLPGEMPDEDDLGALNNILTNQQMNVFRQSVELVKLGVSEEAPLAEPDEKIFSEDDVERAKKLQVEGNPPPKISKIMGVSVPDVIKMLNQ
jgi:hypothetical protein